MNADFGWLEPREKQVLAQAEPYLRQGRPWDLQHVYDELEIFRELMQEEEVWAEHREHLAPAIKLHDIGWSWVKKEIWKGGEFRSKESRKLHMRGLKSVVVPIMVKSGYRKEAAEEVGIMAEEHDNPCFGEEYTHPLSPYLRGIELKWTLNINNFIMVPSDKSKDDRLEERVARIDREVEQGTAIITPKGRRIMDRSIAEVRSAYL